MKPDYFPVVSGNLNSAVNDLQQPPQAGYLFPSASRWTFFRKLNCAKQDIQTYSKTKWPGLIGQ